MAKIFYTDHDIEDLAKQGVQSIDIGDNVVLTDLAVDKARRLGIKLVSARENKEALTVKSQASSAAKRAPTVPAHNDDLEARVYKAVKSRLGDQVDDTLLRTIVRRVVQNISSSRTQ